MRENNALVPAPGTLVSSEINIKRSRFITYLARVESEEEARDFIAEIKHTYPDARHHCSAFIYLVDGANPVERSSDDGEPSGTAGMPMLDVLRGSGLSNIAAVVVRYFGGIKLGTGGLVRAYSEAVQDTLPQVQRWERSRRSVFSIEMSHQDAGRIEAELRGRGITIIGSDYAAAVTMTVACAPEEEDKFRGLLAGLSGGTLTPRRQGHRWVESPLPPA